MSIFLQGVKKQFIKNNYNNNQNKTEEQLKTSTIKISLLEECEKEILRLLFNYGNEILEFEEEIIKVSEYIFDELHQDSIIFSNSFYKNIYKEYFQLISEEKDLNINYFLQHEDSEIQQLAISFVSKKHEISSKWEDLHQIFTGDETKNLELTIEKSILSLKQAFIKSEVEKINTLIKTEEDPSIQLITKLTKLNKGLVIINKLLGRNFN